MNPTIFREYDIRGVAGEDFTEADACLIGKAVGSYLRGKGKTRIAVGKDCRTTSDLYTEHLIEGLLSTGCDVTELGYCATPLLYFSIHHLKLEGGVMVTASHNPPEYNGFKMCCGTDSIHGADIKGLYDLIEAGTFEEGAGSRGTTDILTPYLDYMSETMSISRPLKVGIDAGNGSAGPIVLPLLERFDLAVHPLYCEMDGTFPNHEADPTVLANMEDLVALVREKKLDLGIGYDGDGDRIGVVDETGTIIYGDQLMVIFAREILSRKPGATFISEVKCSQVMYDDINGRGGNAIMWKTGHSLIKEKMKETKAELAGEMSGHIFFADRYFGYDDALYATLRLLEIVADEGKPLSALLSDLPVTFNTPEIRVECPDTVKFAIAGKLKERFVATHTVIDVDGARVLYDDGWGLVRASNTQPALVLRFEALSEESLAAIRSEIEGALEEIIAAS
ncbi:phosphomannomutase [Desulfoluna limicola]|uniref:Phosphomannomutase n=1 Tax=Desulfoluna limicola TaxID=2810562 RepID=A0ABM7PL06_9BACT|nr:phosphomannomutase/phosphoglucomutase [Desulfoluna limicola]BCS98228.1 phosphomannomutase [Desulfoluna limicola]